MSEKKPQVKIKLSDKLFDDKVKKLMQKYGDELILEFEINIKDEQ